MRFYPFFWVCVFCVIGTFPVSADVNGEQLLNEAVIFGNASHIVMTVRMQIDTSRGDKSRGMEIYLQTDENASKLLMQIVHPPFLRYMKFLQYKDGQDSQQWLKTSRGVRRLTGANQSESIFDSDFTVEDFSSIDSEVYSVALLSETVVDGSSVYTLELTPSYTGAQYQRKKLYIDKDTMLIRRIDFFSKNVLYKQYTLLETQKIEGRLFPRVCIMKTMSQQSSTTIFFDEISLPDTIPSRTFNRGSL